MDEVRLQKLADALFPQRGPAKSGVGIGTLTSGGGVAINGQSYAKAPRVGGPRPADGQSAITLPVAGTSQRAVVAYGGYYAPRTTPTVVEDP